MRTGVSGINVTVESQVTNDILTELSIQFDNIGENVLPDGDGTRQLGAAGFAWSQMHSVTLVVSGTVDSNLVPDASTRDLGSSGTPWQVAYANDIQGDARSLILMGLF